MLAHHGASHHDPEGAILGMRLSRLSVSGKIASERAGTAKFQRLAELTTINTKTTGHASRVTGAQTLGLQVSALDVAMNFSRGLRLLGMWENIHQRMELEAGPEQAVE